MKFLQSDKRTRPLRGPRPECYRAAKRPGRILRSECAREIALLRSRAGEPSSVSNGRRLCFIRFSGRDCSPANATTTGMFSLGGAAALLRQRRKHWFDFLDRATALPKHRRQHLFFLHGRDCICTQTTRTVIASLLWDWLHPPAQNNESICFLSPSRGCSPAQTTKTVWISIFGRDYSPAQTPTKVIFAFLGGVPDLPRHL